MSSVAGLYTTPPTIWPSRTSPTEMAKMGSPWRKLVVPSSGSMYQVWLLSEPSTTPSSSITKP